MPVSRKQIHVAAPPSKSLMIFDGDCGFCRRWISRWRSATGDRVEYKTSEESSGRFPEIPPEHFRQAVQFVETDGAVFSGAAAVFKSLSYAPGKAWLYHLYKFVPGFAFLSEAAYRIVARNRPLFSRF